MRTHKWQDVKRRKLSPEAVEKIDRDATDPAVADADRRAAEEMEQFRAALPSLLADDELRGRWVVFKDGEVLRAFDDRAEAHRWAVQQLGRLAGFVVAPVEPERVYHLSGFSRCGFRVPGADE